MGIVLHQCTRVTFNSHLPRWHSINVSDYQRKCDVDDERLWTVLRGWQLAEQRHNGRLSTDQWSVLLVCYTSSCTGTTLSTGSSVLLWHDSVTLLLTYFLPTRVTTAPQWWPLAVVCLINPLINTLRPHSNYTPILYSNMAIGTLAADG